MGLCLLSPFDLLMLPNLSLFRLLLYSFFLLFRFAFLFPLLFCFLDFFFSLFSQIQLRINCPFLLNYTSFLKLFSPLIYCTWSFPLLVVFLCSFCCCLLKIVVCKHSIEKRQKEVQIRQKKKRMHVRPRIGDFFVRNLYM